jgi:hypothetical protein
MSDEPKTPSSRFETIFLRYGAGSPLFHPLTRNKFWNLICWTLIVVGVIGWILALWFIRSNFGASDIPDFGLNGVSDASRASESRNAPILPPPASGRLISRSASGHSRNLA